jgi:hypothetical protein
VHALEFDESLLDSITAKMRAVVVEEGRVESLVGLVLGTIGSDGCLARLENKRVRCYSRQTRTCYNYLCNLADNLAARRQLIDAHSLEANIVLGEMRLDITQHVNMPHRIRHVNVAVKNAGVLVGGLYHDSLDGVVAVLGLDVAHLRGEC